MAKNIKSIGESKMKTIKQFMKYATDTLKQSEIETPVLEAGVILCHVLNCDRSYLYAHDDRVLEEAELERLESLILQRSEKVPLQYLLGETEFMSLTFKVSPAVLIPRQDTELLVERCMELIKVKSASINEASHMGSLPKAKVLDMCTGSGCIAVSIAHYCPEARVTACDVSLDALEIAKTNSRLAGVQDRLDFRRGDLFEALEGGERFDIIASNPPYIETSTVEQLQSEVKDHEPSIALDGGSDGLDFYRRIVEAAPQFLAEGGFLVMEIGYNQGFSVSRLMEQAFEGIVVLQDFGQNDRVVLGRLKTKLQ